MRQTVLSLTSYVILKGYATNFRPQFGSVSKNMEFHFCPLLKSLAVCLEHCMWYLQKNPNSTDFWEFWCGERAWVQGYLTVNSLIGLRILKSCFESVLESTTGGCHFSAFITPSSHLRAFISDMQALWEHCSTTNSPSVHWWRSWPLPYTCRFSCLWLACFWSMTWTLYV